MLPLNYESRPNFPYNFQTLEAAWEQYRDEHQAPFRQLILDRSHLYEALRARLGDDGKRKARPPCGPERSIARRDSQRSRVGAKGT